ncbi:cysteine desulfurase [bacterium]|nr:cysteine desulfurase [bacterium]
MQAYFDNAATTAMDPEVVERMAETMRSVYGNPSAIHALGRKARAEVELARKSIAKWLNCNSKEIYFTGSGTEGDNMAIRCAVNDLNVTHIITSAIEHKAVLDTSKELERKELVQVHLVNLNPDGSADLLHLEELASKYQGALISLMHANNEIGTLNPLKEISKIARANNCYFHSDTVQSMAHYTFDLQDLDLDFLTCSAHKFHGPKGVGFLYKNQNVALKPIITGGGQESKLRAGTENVFGIVGLATAMDIAYQSLEEDQAKIQNLKKIAADKLLTEIPGVAINGASDPDKSLFTVLNISFPHAEVNTTLLFQLDLAGICVSGGSACNSGAVGESHVLAGLNHPKDRTAIRISFSKYNTEEEIDFLVEQLKSLYLVPA